MKRAYPIPFSTTALFSSLSLLALALAPSWAQAQNDKFTQYMTEGIRLYKEAEYDSQKYYKAIEAFEQASRINPIPDITYNIARSYHQLGDCPNALKGYQQYQREIASGLGKDVSSYIENLKQQCGQERATLVLQCQPQNATVRIDNERPVPCNGSHRLRVGERKLVFMTEDGQSSTRLVNISAQGPNELSIDLLRASSRPTVPLRYGEQPQAAYVPESSAKVPLSERYLFWTGIATSSVGALTTGIGSIVFAFGYSPMTNSQGQPTNRFLKNNKTLVTGGIMMGVGTAMTLTGVALLLVDAFWDRPSHNAFSGLDSLRPHVQFGPDAASFGLQMTF